MNSDKGDLELTRLCAEAMEYAIADYNAYVVGRPGVGVVKKGECIGFVFDPLHDDAQAMALLKRYPSECLFRMHMAYAQSRQLHPIPMDLNRAICIGAVKERTTGELSGQALKTTSEPNENE